MRQLAIYRNGELAGFLIEENRESYIFRYESAYFADNTKPAISLTLPKKEMEYKSECLFPFFSNIFSEGVNRKLQSKLLKIDEADDFGLLTKTAQYDTIGAITVKEVKS